MSSINQGGNDLFVVKHSHEKMNSVSDSILWLVLNTLNFDPIEVHM